MDTQYRTASASRDVICAHLTRCADSFIPSLHERVDVVAYAAKISAHAVTFEAWAGETLVGLVAAYLNDGEGRAGYITSVSVDRGYGGMGIARELVARCIRRARELGFRTLRLEVSQHNERAISLYRKAGFEPYESRGESVMMMLRLDLERDSAGDGPAGPREV
jgi:ribosomal protein S18 acetylase RimI-like enzyme